MSRTTAAALALLGARVLYRIHERHQAVEQVQARDEKGVLLFDDETYNRDGDGAEVIRQVPRMETVSEGSVHHRAMREFVGFIARVREDDDEKSDTYGEMVYDLVLLVPNAAPVSVDGVFEGDEEHHTFTVLDGDEVDHADLAENVKSMTAALADMQNHVAQHMASASALKAVEDRLAKLEAALKA